MEKLQDVDLDDIFRKLTTSGSPVKTAFSLNRELNGKLLPYVFEYGFINSNKKLLNIAHMTLLLERIYRINYFIRLVYEDKYFYYLYNLSILERKQLLDDFILKWELGLGSYDDREVYEILRASLEEDSSYQKKNI